MPMPKLVKYSDVPSSTDKSTFPSGERAIDCTFFRFSNGRVRDLLLDSIHNISGYSTDYTKWGAAHFTRSKTDTLFPTGLSTEFPSGVNTTLPCRYTVPHRFCRQRERRFLANADTRIVLAYTYLKPEVCLHSGSRS